MKIKNKNTPLDISISPEFIKGIRLVDIDNTIAKYMQDTIIPTLEENGTQLKVPLLYANAERWQNVRKDGYLRDVRGKIQIPLIIIKRNGFERDNSLTFFREKVTLPAFRKYSPKHKYERFNVQNAVSVPMELYNVSMPDYVTVTYEVVLWTSYTEHMNTLAEAFQYASDRYWGEDSGYKFRAVVGSMDNQQEMGDGTERIIKTNFTLVVHAYLLPETYGGVPTVTKELSKKAILITTEVSETNQPQLTLYSEYLSLLDFNTLNSTQNAVFISENSVVLNNVIKPMLPIDLIGQFDINDWFSVKINGIEFFDFSYEFDNYEKTIVFTFNNLPNVLLSSDEILIEGKFIQLR